MGYKRTPKHINGKEYWECTRCNNWFLKSDFYKDKRSSFGIKSECKKCHIKTSIESRDSKKHKISNRNWHRKSGYNKRPKVKERERVRSKRRCRSIKAKCRDILNDAVAHGVIERPSKCSRCGGEGMGIEAHHKSYYHPMDVVWLCTVCHADDHAVGLVL